MRPLLGIELGPSRCVLVAVEDGREAGGALHATARHVVKYTDPVRLTEDLRRLRAEHRLPRRARVVVWPGAGDSGVNPVDSPTAASGFRPDLWQLRERLRPIVRAGFRVRGVLAPSEAAAVLGSIGSPSPVLVMAIAPDGGALAVVSGGRTVLARDLSWRFAPPRPDAAMVDRYAFAAQVLPLVSHVIAETRRQGVRVDRIVLCGAAPGVRMLAAPMIEELDLEVETLDGVGGVLVPDAAADDAAALQLAAAAATAPDDAGILEGLDRPVLTPARILVGAAAAAAVILLVLLFWPARQASGPPASSATPGSTKPKRVEPDRVRSAMVGVPCARKSVSA